MAESYTEVKRTGYGERITGSLFGVIFGILFFLGSFVLLFWNEGRFDLSLLARTATEIASDTVSTDTALQGKLVSTTGTLTSEEELGDGLYLKSGNYIAVERKVEMFAWHEHQETKTETNVGGSQTETTTYEYEEEWLEDPEPSSGFRYPEGHTNPTKTLESTAKRVKTAEVGVYEVADVEGVELPDSKPLVLTAENTTLTGGAVLESEEFIFISKTAGSTLADPEVGDLRVSYQVLEAGTEVTFFGQLDGSKISPHLDQSGNRLYRLFAGTRDEAVATLHEEFELLTWILRIVGFLLMWFGMMLVFEPLSVLLDFLPILGTLSRTAVGAVTLLVALVLSIVTILVSRVLHNPLWLAIFLVLAIALIFKGVWKTRLAKIIR